MQCASSRLDVCVCVVRVGTALSPVCYGALGRYIPDSLRIKDDDGSYVIRIDPPIPKRQLFQRYV